MSEGPTDDVVAAVPRRGGWPGAALAWGGVAAVVLLWLVTGTARSWRAPPALFVAGVTFLPYLYAAVAATIFAIWTIVPDRRAPPVALGLLALSAGALWGPAVGWGEREGVPVRVMTWNVRRLWGPPEAIGTPDDRRRATACVVGTVTSEDPDVVVLLEVSAVDVASLSARLNLSCVHGDYMGVDRDDLGGLAVCVRDERWRIRSGGPRRFVDDEDWYYAFAEIERDEHVFNVFAIHLRPYSFGMTAHRAGLDRGDPGALIAMERHGNEVSRAQVDQAAALLDRMAKLRDPTVVLGDFNSTRDTALHVALRRVLADAWERGGRGFGGTVRFFDRVPLRVDYAYVTAAFDIRGARVPEAPCSDHQPVVADLVLATDP